MTDQLKALIDQLDDYYDHDDSDEEFIGYDRCMKCNRDYDEIDKEYQICSKCGWDEEGQKYTKPRQPTASDYMCGNADILTRRWN